jgi:hypothetical protein
MFGIVESIGPGMTLADFARDVNVVVDHVARLLREWIPSS